MDRVNEYRSIVRRVIADYAEGKPSRGQIEVETILDSDRDHFEVMFVGWNGQHGFTGQSCTSTSSTARSGSSTTAPIALSQKS